MSDAQTYGNLVLRSDVTHSVVHTLRTWMPQYTAFVSRKVANGVSEWLPAPQSYVVSNDAAHYPEDQPPAVVVACPGTVGSPRKDGSRYYRTMWDVAVTVYVTSQDRQTTEDLASYYGGAVRAILTQKASLGGLAAGTEWKGESFGLHTPDTTQQTLGSCTVKFQVDTRDAVLSLGGPALGPIAPAPGDFPIADTVTVTIEPEAL